MRCKYCRKKVELKRFIDTDYQGDLIRERFVWVCETCKVILSPKFALICETETEREKQLMRNFLLQVQDNHGKKENPPNN